MKFKSLPKFTKVMLVMLIHKSRQKLTHFNNNINNEIKSFSISSPPKYCKYFQFPTLQVLKQVQKTGCLFSASLCHQKYLYKKIQIASKFWHMRSFLIVIWTSNVTNVFVMLRVKDSRVFVTDKLLQIQFKT